MVIQSVIIEKKYFTRKEADYYIRTHGYKLSYYNKGVDITAKTYRYRQLTPKKVHKYFTKKTGTKGVSLVLGKLKTNIL